MANHLVADRVKETSTTTGTGNMTLAGAVSTFQAFSAVYANNETFFYVIQHQSANEFEVGFGTFVSATPAIARTSIIESSNADAAVSFSAGTKDIFVTSPAIGQGWGTLRVTPSANQNDYNPTGLKYCNVLEINGSISLKLTGLQGGFEGRRILIRNVATDFLLWLENENTASSAANRFKLPKGFPAFLMPGDNIEFIYNNTATRWEVIAWPCMGPAMGLTSFDDFIGTATHGSNVVRGESSFSLSGTAASAQAGAYLVNTTERPVGVLQVDTGTTATGRVGLGGLSADSIIPTLAAALSVARVAVEAAGTATEDFRLHTGFRDAVNAAVVDGVLWEYRWNGAAVEWSQSRFANSVATRSVTGSPTPNTNYIWLVVFVNPGWTRADFIYSEDSIAFTKADSPTTGLPGSTQPTGWSPITFEKVAGITQRNADIDLGGFRIDQVRG